MAISHWSAIEPVRGDRPVQAAAVCRTGDYERGGFLSSVAERGN